MILFKRKRTNYRLPTGVVEFDCWADRIISKVKFAADKDSMRFVLANEIGGLGPTEVEKEDEYFVARLHKVAANQVAQAKAEEIKRAVRERKEKERQEQESKSV